MMMSDAGTPAASSAFFSIGWSNSTYRVELVVSGRIAATFPLPLLPSDCSTFNAVNVLLNELAEIVGVPPDPPLVLVPLLLALALELPLALPPDDADEAAALLDLLLELPHAATARQAQIAATTRKSLLLSKCTTSSVLSLRRPRDQRPARPDPFRSQSLIPSQRKPRRFNRAVKKRREPVNI